MTGRQPSVQPQSTAVPSARRPWRAAHQQAVLRRTLTVGMFLLLGFFLWSVTYTLLMAGWGLVHGIDFRDETTFVWWGLADWVILSLSVLLVVPFLPWLWTQVAHFVEDGNADPYAVISRWSQELDGAGPDENLYQAVARSLAETLDVPYVRLETGHDGPSATVGIPNDHPPIRLPLHYDQRPLGTLQIGTRVVGGVPLHVDGQLLADLTRQVSLTLYAAQLSADLQESRRRIVTAREEGRRQLRRDLHDGLGPSLATLTMQADTARELVYADPAATERLLAQLADQAQATVGEVRRIVHGLRPPALDDMGLFGALEVLAGSFASPRLAVEAHIPATRPTLAAALEVAVYRIVQEALTNIARHAHAAHATLNVACDDAHLRVRICDDGLGMPAQPAAGLGLQSMRARAEELGGQFSVQANTPSGTCITAQFILESEDTLDRRDPHPDL